MKLAANITLLFQDQPLEDRPLFAAEAGFEGVEMQFPYAIPPVTWAQRLQEARLPLVLMNLPAGDLMEGGLGLACQQDRQSAFYQAVDQALEYIHALQPKVVNLLAGRYQAEQDPQDCLAQLEENLHWVLERLPAGTLLTCEPLNSFDQPRYLLATYAQWRQLAERVQHPAFRYQLDLYHAARMGENLTDLITLAQQDLGHIQFADVPGRGQPGTGQLDFVPLWKQLQAQGYSGWVSAEYLPQGDQHLAWQADFFNTCRD